MEMNDMKKMGLLLVLLMFMIGLCACSEKSYDAVFDDFQLPDDGLRLGMTVDELLAIYPDCEEIDDGIYKQKNFARIFRFKEGTLDSMAFTSLANLDNSKDKTIENFGETDESKNGVDFWYGTLYGTKCYLSLSSFEKNKVTFEYGLE